ncbi:hypothetical protein BB559_005992 [Furculomyces boomerangus]|uniref:Major facilitator superfamily (MFS) profile domain-containing protein n=1 Tax=Furculomyces boomerangus TaxID=61424 RepID=A0A2T9Y5D1_9FUNG|nr:hypothetical protein BB559_005992 [Furculomyces boomerangus]
MNNNTDIRKTSESNSLNSAAQLGDLSISAPQSDLNTKKDFEEKMAEPANDTKTPEGPPPDQGYAWVIMVACFVNVIFAFGSFNAFGVFQTYYLEVLFVDVPADQIAWISTLCGVFTLSGGLTAGPIIRRIGMRYTSILGTFIACIGLILASFSTKVWQLVLTQGVIFGFGCSIIVNISLTAPALWFVKHRGAAIGLVASAGGFGALVLIPVVTKVVEVSNVWWAFRVLCLMYFVCTLAGGMLLKPRIGYTPINKIIDFSLLKDPVAMYICLSGFLFNIGYNVPLLYFPASLVQMGKSENLATNLIMVFCTFSALSRFISGYLAKKINPIDIMIVSHAISGIIMLAMWYKATSFGVHLAFYFLFGFFGLPFFALGPVVTAGHFKHEKISQVNGLSYLVMGFAVLIGIPSLGAIFQTYGKRTDYSQIIIIGAIFYLLSVIPLVALRHYIKK